jgi:CHASE3 domain sensor protein
MSEKAASVIDQQLKELNAIAARTAQDLNTVSGAERIAQWKVRTVNRLQQVAAKNEADELARKSPGPAFTNDLIEEFNDEVDCYRSCLVALAKRLRSAAPPQP